MIVFNTISFLERVKHWIKTLQVQFSSINIYRIDTDIFSASLSYYFAKKKMFIFQTSEQEIFTNLGIILKKVYA